MNDNKLKHLEFLQNVITRMNTNSFLIKGWSVTLVAAIFALAADKANINYAIIAYIPVAVFWVLDGFFLSQERQYRGLYAEVSRKDEASVDFRMDAAGFNKGERTWPKSMFSRTLLVFHGTLIAVICIVMFVLPSLPNRLPEEVSSSKAGK